MDRRPIIVVEGPSDERLIGYVAGEDFDAVIFVACGRENVLRTALQAKGLGIDRIVCLVDRDFDERVMAAEQSGAPVLAYDDADIEAMLTRSPSAARLVNEFGSDTKLFAFGGPALLIERMLVECEPVSRLRRANALEGWGIRFDEVDISAKLDRNTLKLNVRSLCASLSATSDDVPNAQTLMEFARDGDVPICPRTARSLVRGRDIWSFVGVALRKVVGTREKQATGTEMLTSALRAGVDRSWLRSTGWFGELGQMLSLSLPSEK